MENSNLTEMFKNISTAKELAAVLNEIKQIEFGSIRYSISVKMLRHFSSDKIAPKRFRTFNIRKKKWRSPRNKGSMQAIGCYSYLCQHLA